MALDLALVMPVFNEEECIADVVRSWLIALADLKIQFRMIVLNDGSYDATKEALSVFADEERIEIVNKDNSGHGPTILIGYNKGVQIAEWVFQCDSDDEMKPEHFANLWKQRQNYDALFGIRTNRKQNLSRKLISICSRKVVRLLFGKGVSDVNTPYRLIRSVLLKQIINHVPSNSFASPYAAARKSGAEPGRLNVLIERTNFSSPSGRSSQKSCGRAASVCLWAMRFRRSMALNGSSIRRMKASTVALI